MSLITKMSEERNLDLKKPIENDSVSSRSHDQSSETEASSAATSKSKSQADKFSTRIIQYSTKELTIVEEKSLIGSGGFGIVRKYHHKEKIVAIKEFGVAGNDETVAKIWNMVQHEANILCRFQHENIVEILGVTQWPNIVGIIMEYVDGGNLQNLLSEDNQSKLLWNTRLEIANGITSGLDYIHNYGKKKTCCHGDLKPANVLLTSELQAKLADFGSAAFYRATAASTTTTKQVSSTQFTLVYVAPEFLEDNTRARDPAMDMYSFGMVLYELISGKAPYSDSSMPNVVPALILAKIKPSGKLIDESENQLESDDSDREAFSFLKKVMQKCWNNDPASRPRSEIVKTDISSCLIKRQGSSSPNRGMETVSIKADTNEEKHVTELSEKKLSKQEENPSSQASSASLSFLGDDEPSTSSGIFSPKHTSRSKGESGEILKVPGPIPFRGNSISDRDFLEKYTDSLLSKDYEQADVFKAALRSYIIYDVSAGAEDVRAFAEKLRNEKKYLQSIAIFDTAAALFSELKNPEDDMEKIQFCVRGIYSASEKMIKEDSNMKAIVRKHVLPLMRDWVRHMKTTTQVLVKWRCHVVSWVLSYIEVCEKRVELWEERKHTLEEAVSGMRRVFGRDVHKQQGRLFGTLLNNLGTAYKRESRFEEAVVLFREAVVAEKAAFDYFGDESTRREHLKISESNVQSSLKKAWEKQLKMK